MKIIRHIERRSLALPASVLTMGNFDGIHVGHQALLRRVIQDAGLLGNCSVVLTFEPHPLRILNPALAPRLILTHKDKLRLLQSCGIDVVVIQEFNAAFARLQAEEFVKRYLLERLGVRKIWVGRDLRFGRGRKGRVDDLIRWGKEGGFEVGVMDSVQVEGERVSSSRIREMVEGGDVHAVEPLLGRYHFISGRVVPGRRRGKDLGFPTANVVTRTEVLPLDGIYATLFEVDGLRLPSVTSIGVNPTFGEGPKTIETYIFDFAGDLYGRSVRLYFVRRIREERKFSSPDLLAEQMKRDVLSAQEILGTLKPGEWTGLVRQA